MTGTWLKEDNLKESGSFILMNNEKKKFYTEYTLPLIFRDSLLIAMKSSPDFLTRAVSVDENELSGVICQLDNLATHKKTNFNPGENVVFKGKKLSAFTDRYCIPDPLLE